MPVLQKVIETVAKLTPDKKPDPLMHKGGHIGKPCMRVDGQMKVKGEAHFTADYKIDAYRLAQLGFNVLAPSLFNMFGIPGTNHIGQGADLQAKHSDPEFLGKLDEAWQYLTGPMKSDPGE